MSARWPDASLLRTESHDSWVCESGTNSHDRQGEGATKTLLYYCYSSSPVSGGVACYDAGPVGGSNERVMTVHRVGGSGGGQTCIVWGLRVPVWGAALIDALAKLPSPSLQF